MSIQNHDMFCYGNFPQPPDWLISNIKKSVEIGYRLKKGVQFVDRPSATKQDFEEFHRTRKEYDLAGEKYSRAIYRRYELSSNSLDWIRENIGEFTQCGSQLMRDGESFLPHTDGGPRRYIINYLVDPGGDTVSTDWYREPGYDVYRDGPPLHLNQSQNLELLHREVFATNSWTVLYGKVLHAVSGMTRPRIQLSMGLSAEEFLKVKERFNLELTYHG